MTGPLVVGEAVREALEAGRPVLALESTIFTHGLPRPRNIEVATEAEARLRAAGVVPATIGVLDGIPTVGLSPTQIERRSISDDVIKASLRDLPIAAAKGLSAGTTVAATAHLAHLAGLRVFATGGLGGVQRRAQETFDESADLPTLARLPILIVTAGVKSILDIPLTLERLETLNHAVVGYRTTDYPGFYIADSGYDIEYAVDTPGEIAPTAAARDALGPDATLPSPTPSPPTPSWTPTCTTRCSPRRSPRPTPRGSPATTPPPTCSTTSSARPTAGASTSTWRCTRATWRSRERSRARSRAGTARPLLHRRWSNLWTAGLDLWTD